MLTETHPRMTLMDPREYTIECGDASKATTIHADGTQDGFDLSHSDPAPQMPMLPLLSLHFVRSIF
ncbi:hypothetical protein RJZ57_004203, partial [Blastomyces gilchristii]